MVAICLKRGVYILEFPNRENYTGKFYQLNFYCE